MEEIMINGVDVSECKFYSSEICNDCYEPIDIPYCKDDDNCIYKQLKRKEMECEKLKKQLSCSTEFPGQCHCAFRCLGNDWCDEAENRFKRYKEECETLMEEKTKLNLIIDRLLKAGGYDEDTCNPYDFEEVYQDLEYKRKQFDKYKQALEKIKEEIDNRIECNQYGIDHDVFNETACKYMNYEIKHMKELLQIIKECK